MDILDFQGIQAASLPCLLWLENLCEHPFLNYKPAAKARPYDYQK